MSEFIPVNEPLLDGNEKKYLNQCIDTGWISSEGPFVKQFESNFAKKVDREFGIAVSNGSVALTVAVVALGIGQGDEVILPTFTIISCVEAVVRTGATPVLVDCDPLSWNMDTQEIESKITSATKAIMIVHIYGLPVDMNPIIGLAKKYGLKIIEDAAQMHGQSYWGKPCGSFGEISTFSFYPNKHITTGEGGMIVTNDEALAHKCQSLRNLCFQTSKRFVHEELGWNFRMSNIQAALGVAQLERLDEFVNKKKEMGAFYSKLLKNIPGLQLPIPKKDYANNIYWVYGVVLHDQVAMDAQEVINQLSRLKIGTRPFFWPMHEQPVFKKMGLFAAEKMPGAEQIARRGFYLPSGMTLTQKQMKIVASALIKILKV
jgi:perosamine synthetase